MQHEKMQFITTTMKECFHVHTSRCKHASDDTDEDYIEAALRMGASKIVFTDHCPFPGNPFRNRMDIEQLPEYIQSLNFLKRKYMKLIDVKIGLETEYLPSFRAYYKKLIEMEGLELMILGQHFYEVEPEVYSFSMEEKYCEYLGLGKAILYGIKSGCFSAVAHPDRIFRRKTEWDESMTELSKEIIDAAKDKGVLLEINESSIRRKQYKQEFWDLVPCDVKTIEGIDAHSVAELNEEFEINH
ncbi:MAG: PHP domain-containing protein [Mobilitalea sp.]